jgi:uncharacterized protein involved in oxidation of intracellular sulfur
LGLKKRFHVKLGIVLTVTEPETVFNALRLANFASKEGDEVGVFLLGKGVELDTIEAEGFDVQAQAQNLLDSGGKIMACGTCLKIRGSEGSELCPISTMKDLYELVKTSDHVLTF